MQEHVPGVHVAVPPLPPPEELPVQAWVEACTHDVVSSHDAQAYVCGPTVK
jgi:hypothetical protein